MKKKDKRGAINEVLPLSYTGKTYSPFDFHNPTYLQHLREMLKLRETKDAITSKREALIEQFKRDNYKQQLLRPKSEIPHYDEKHPTRLHLEKHKKDPENLIKM